jgi:hypothetical protein
MNMTPLGWSHGKILFAVANTTDTSLYEFAKGHTSFVSILMPQVLTSLTLSPDGNTVAFEAPTNCTFCTVDLYDLLDLKVWVGPSGSSHEQNLAWSRDGRHLAAQVGRSIALIDARSHAVQTYPLPRRLPNRWGHSFRAELSGDTLRMVDRVTAGSYTSHA